MQDAIRVSKTRNAGYVYVTDDTLANPWDSLPAQSYWTDEQNQVGPSGWPGASPPSPPVSVAVQSVSGTSVDISWTNSPVSTPTVSTPVTAYDIYENGIWTSSVNAGVTTFRAGGLHPSTGYGFAVRARDAAGKQSDPSVVTATTEPAVPNPPGPPDAPSTDATEYTSTILRWSPASPGDEPVVGYEIHQDGTKIMSVPADTTSLTIGGLASGGRTATFTVTALDASGGMSVPSAPAAATTLPLPGGESIGSAEAVAGRTLLTYRARFHVPFAFHRIFIAASNASGPCWLTSSVPQLCAAYLIENTRLLKYDGTGSDWKWSTVSDVTPTVRGHTYTWAIPPSAIESPRTQTVVFQGDGYAPSSYSSVISPTFRRHQFQGIPPPEM
jgi:hypothetical protein